MLANYNRVRLVGSCVLGAFFAAVPAFVFNEDGDKPKGLLIFIPLMIVFTRVLLWIWRRGDMAYADSVRRRYEKDGLPLGGVKVNDDFGAETVTFSHKDPSDDEKRYSEHPKRDQ